MCKWYEDGDSGVWATQCRKYFQITDGTPEDNKMLFCCYCGEALEQVPYSEDGE
jgi:hypothetical protein